MGPTIILDKSAIQTLSAREALFLGKYYAVNVAPVLVLEILADLYKTSSKSIKKCDVPDLAKKLLVRDSAVNVHYSLLLEASLMGHVFGQHRQIVISETIPVRNTSDQIGFRVPSSHEEQALHRWREEDFTQAEHVLAQRWREVCSQIDLPNAACSLNPIVGTLPRLKTIAALEDFTSEISRRFDLQSSLLAWLMDMMEVRSQIRPLIRERWLSEKPGRIASFAPYAHHCLRANLFFYVGVLAKLIGPRPTHKIDVEYLYYLPFCSVFVSKDKLHEKIVPFLLEEDQTFVQADALKKDLSRIAASVKSAQDGSRPSYGGWPPEIPGSLTCELWKKYCRSRPSSGSGTGLREGSHLSGADKKRILELLKTGEDRGCSVESDMNSVDFIVKERIVRTDDPCPCGSGLAFDECHLAGGETTDRKES